MSTRPDRSPSQKDVRVLLPMSMTNAGLVNENTDEIEMLIYTSKLYGTECPTSAAQLPVNAPVYARSNCPWYYELQNDTDRFPTSLPKAISKCGRQCLGLHENIKDDFTCDYIYQDVTVLMKEYHKNVLHFVEKVESIPVVSTCVRKKETR
ncbi:Interleukin 17-like protein [Mizuhopecten yessoensis]|uniref:Interleukin 17-like protein n=1 Tax=Mizuhopecten yessoensis TaxID=6573 RepID=A0A210Q482_MIZYE|nr:Interleukin 17-like protein [Mizuhopecten yessoensis]OWF43550.1 Interleukin 17-like protein [Mizuhopecten yessoensis]